MKDVSVDQTKARLIEAAGIEFAEKGFEGATVRAICVRAQANQAAVNYHFGDKEQLYDQAVQEAHRCSAGQPPAPMGHLEPTEAFRRYVENFLLNVVALRGETWHHNLILREMFEPTHASETLVRESIRPRFQALSSILGRICPAADERRLQALAFSVVGQCLHYKFSQPISERLIGAEAYARLDVDYLIDHITRFTLAALGAAPPFGAGGEHGSSPSPSHTVEGDLR